MQRWSVSIPKSGEYVLKLLQMNDYDGNSAVNGRTWLQKMMYACHKDHPAELDYKFKPYNYGMFSPVLASVVDELQEAGLVCMETTEENKRSPIHLTESGMAAADGATGCNPEVLETMRSVKTTLNSLDYRELVVLMYHEYPEMRKNTNQSDEYRKWRESAALSMVSGGKISFSLGATISGLGREEFRTKLDATF